MNPVHTNAFSKGSVFVFIESASIHSCPHYRFDAFSTVNTKTIDLHVVTQVEHYAHVTTHAPAIFYDARGTYDVIVFILMRFRPSALIRYVCVFVLIHFQERFHRKRSAHLRVDGTPERIEMYPFSNENALVSTGTL